MKLLSQPSPIAVHFGALETRFLQLEGGRGGWSVRSSKIVPAQGIARHASVAEAVVPVFKAMHMRGRDAVVGMSGESVSVSLVPVDPNNRNKLDQALQETALRTVKDPEGVQYRFLNLAGESGESSVSREEYLLLAVGESEIRRCRTAVESMNLRSVGIEMNAFPIARALQLLHEGEEEPWGFLHLGFSHSLFGVVHGEEIRFLKPMQLTGHNLLQTLQRALADCGTVPQDSGALMGLLANSGEGDGEETSQAPAVDGGTLTSLKGQAEGHAVEILHSLRMESEALAQEVRACLRHFATRHKGARTSIIYLTGFGASLPEVEKAVSTALGITTAVATPFSDLGIKASDEILSEEHMWCEALGLAIRGTK